jgi:hypothetical protein
MFSCRLIVDDVSIDEEWANVVFEGGLISCTLEAEKNDAEDE